METIRQKLNRYCIGIFRRSRYPLFLLTLCALVFFFVIKDYRQKGVIASIGLQQARLYEKYESLMRDCEKKYNVPNEFKLRVLPNVREVKHAKMQIREIQSNEKCIVVMFGIGRNVHAETALRELYPKACRFYGLDPDPIPNKKLFESLNGSYYEAAIASENGDKEAVVLTNKGYRPFKIKHVALFDYLTKQMEATNIIDWFSIDIEGGEIDLFPSLLRGGTFDKLNISVCQLNMELHLERNAVVNVAIHNFLRDATLERRFAFMKVERPYLNRITYYAINIKDPLCVKRYVSPNGEL